MSQLFWDTGWEGSGFRPPSGMDEIVLGCPNCPWDTGGEIQSDLGHPVGWTGLPWDVSIVLGTQDGKDSGIWVAQWDGWDYPGMSQLYWDTGWEGQWDLGHPVEWMGLSWDVPIIFGTEDGGI